MRTKDEWKVTKISLSGDYVVQPRDFPGDESVGRGVELLA